MRFKGYKASFNEYIRLSESYTSASEVVNAFLPGKLFLVGGGDAERVVIQRLVLIEYAKSCITVFLLLFYPSNPSVSRIGQLQSINNWNSM